MTLLFTTPFDRLLRLQTDLERTLGASSLGFEKAGGVFPPLNIFDDRDNLVIRAEVPGFGSGDLDVTVERHSLVIKGERRREEHAKPGGYHRLERKHGRFARSIGLPSGVDTSRMSAKCRNGLLTIRIPKTEAAKPKQIAIQTAA